MSDPTAEPTLDSIASGAISAPEPDTQVAQVTPETVQLRTNWRTASFDSRVPGAPLITQSWTTVPKSLSAAVLEAAKTSQVTLEAQ